MTWSAFIAAVAVAVACLSLMNSRDVTNQTRYSVACEGKRDLAINASRP